MIIPVLIHQSQQILIAAQLLFVYYNQVQQLNSFQMEPYKKQASRINYANQKHHIQQLRQQIDPKVIERIEVDSNPSLNYKNAFKTVYFDELEKTMKYQEDKRAREKNNTQMSPNSRIQDTPIYRNSSIPSLNKSFLPLDEGKNNSVLGTRVQTKSIFIDYDFERKKKFEHLIQGGYDGGKSFFNAQEEYQRRKQEQSKIMKNALLQQIQLKQNKKILQYITHNQESQVFKQNRNKQIQEQLAKARRQRMQHVQIGQQVKLQAENERIKRSRKSYFELNCVGRHNPITNPIEYHIDNPYILQKYTNKVQNEPNNREETNKSTTDYSRRYHNDFIR